MFDEYIGLKAEALPKDPVTRGINIFNYFKTLKESDDNE
jgi:hypothetical protein